jgi:hypothetical protein
MGFRDGKGYHATLLTGDQEISPFEWSLINEIANRVAVEVEN